MIGLKGFFNFTEGLLKSDLITMINLIEVKEKLANFYDIESETDREELLSELRKYADEKEEVELIEEIRQNFKLKTFSGISVIYEALSEQPEKWSQFFYEEYKRAFKLAENSENAFDVLECLEEVGFVDVEKMQHRKEIVELLFSYLSSPHDVLRYKSIWLIGDWISKEDVAENPSIVKQLQSLLIDKNWRIRYAANQELKELGKLPLNFKISFWDKLRVKYFNPYEMT